MMRINRLIALAFLVFYSGFLAQAQEEGTRPLSGNSILQNHKQKNTAGSQKTSSASVYLPFSDDFSYWGPYPDPNKWQTSQSVFINRTYPIAPPTIGVATFDGLSRFGYPYNISATGGSYHSDTLMSVPIRLDSTQTTAITKADSVYLSFYYEAKGRGDLPEPNDVLSLFFIAPDDTSNDFLTGTPVWSKSGYNFGLPTNDTGFHRVMIPIVDDVFFQDTAVKTGFRFVFVNWGTQSGAIDHWHIDQVYLHKGRNINDTVSPDISFVYDEQSLLKNYMQMPYRQFAGSSDMDTVVRAVLRNNNNVKSGNHWNGQANITTGYKIFDNAGVQVAGAIGGTNNVFNFDSIGYCKDNALIRPSLGGYSYNAGPFPNTTDSTSFLLKFFINVIDSTMANNDTAYFRQNFQNYYAYDDGTAEAAYYGPFVNGSTQIALKYKVNVPDTLRAMDIFFDPVSGVNFTQNLDLGLVVWADNAGRPGSPLLFDSSSVLAASAYPHPVYSKNGYDIFARYQLSKGVPLDSGATFYIGTYQVYTTQLGIGMDMNHDTHSKIYYLGTTGWTATTCNACRGSLMMRPVFGDSAKTVRVESFKNEKENTRVYPNPASEEVYISSSEKILKVLISDMLGNILTEEKNTTGKISVSSLPNGLYLLRTFDTKGSVSTQKLIISR